MNPCFPDEDTAENRLKRTLFIVEATSFEQHTLWRDHSIESRYSQFDMKSGMRMKWEQVNPGWLVTVGKLDKRPCCISVSWARIDGQLVMFYEQCSQVTDSVQTEKWLDENFKGTYDNGHRRAQIDAMNFGHCLAAIREQKEKE